MLDSENSLIGENCESSGDPAARPQYFYPAPPSTQMLPCVSPFAAIVMDAAPIADYRSRCY